MSPLRTQICLLAGSLVLCCNFAFSQENSPADDGSLFRGSARWRTESAAEEISDRVNHDRGIEDERDPESTYERVPGVREYEPDHEALFQGAVEQDGNTPLWDQGRQPHGNPHEADHDPPMLNNDRVVLQVRKLGDVGHGP